jgi:riboflavin kinase
MDHRIPDSHRTIFQEIHVMHTFESDFYGQEMKVVVLGYIRPELDYVSRGDEHLIFRSCCRIDINTAEGLIEDIETDKRVAINSLNRPEYDLFRSDPYFIS